MCNEQHQMILDHYGKDRTLLKLSEECSELSKAIATYIHLVLDKNHTSTELKELLYALEHEMADVYETLARARLIIDLDSENIRQIRISQRNKTLNRIGKGING